MPYANITYSCKKLFFLLRNYNMSFSNDINVYYKSNIFYVFLVLNISIGYNSKENKCQYIIRTHE